MIKELELKVAQAIKEFGYENFKKLPMFMTNARDAKAPKKAA